MHLQQLGTALAYDHRYAEASKLFRDVIEKQDNSAGQGNRFGRCGMTSPAWQWLPTIPMTHFSIYGKPSIAGIKMPMPLMADDDLKNLRHNPKFQQLVAELKHPPTKAQIQ